MKKFLSFVCLVLLSLTATAQTNNVIIKQIPKNFKINDNIKVVNKSPYHILQIVVSQAKTGWYLLLGEGTNISSNDEVEIASFSNNKLKKLRGQTIAVKVKALKRPLAQIDDLDNIDSKDLTYNFDVRLSENRHDLIIEVIRPSGHIMDF